MNYIQKSYYSRVELTVTTKDLLVDFVSYRRPGSSAVTTDIAVRRLQDLIARIADHLNLELTDFIYAHELEYQYVPVPSIDSD